MLCHKENNEMDKDLLIIPFQNTKNKDSFHLIHLYEKSVIISLQECFYA